MIAWLLPFSSRASHIIGGDVSMQAVGITPGLFRLQLNQYWDATQVIAGSVGNPGNQDESVVLRIYRKQNPILIEKVTLRLQETLPLTFDNAACATIRQLSFTQARYYTNYQFNIANYTDPGGYYIVWERCCRNDGLTNVNSAVTAGAAMTFYLEFPPMTKNGSNLRNSSPEFRIPNGEYICINKLFTFEAGATDADGDQLRYSLVTPLNGYTTRTAPTAIDESPKTSYPSVSWAAGYSLSNIIPGNPSLSINPTTGQLSVRASQEGLYLFTVQCEEYRNGERIGVVRRDFQLPVVDCVKNTLPPAVVMANGKVASDLVWCGSQPLILSVEQNSTWAYQWQKDGVNLRGSTSDTLQVNAPGVYTVVKSQAKACVTDTTSQAIKVTYVTAPPVSLSLTTPKPYCTGDTITIQAQGQPDYQYRWRVDGKDIVGAEHATLRVYQSGLYTVMARPTLAVCDGIDTLRVVINPKPTTQIKSPASVICSGDSIQFTADGQTGYRYRWDLNGAKLVDTTARLTVRQAGTYQVTVTAPTGCTATSSTVKLTTYNRPVVLMDSIPPVCVSNSAMITLAGQPSGGTYSGSGVQGNQFNPAAVGIGTYTLTYTVVSDSVCRTQRSRQVEVVASPVLTGQTVYWLAKGNSVQLVTKSDQVISSYRWTPPESLNRSDIESPTASPQMTTPYSVTAVGTTGCIGIFAVRVEVSTPLYIPSAFSPNDDGNNDQWVLPNISEFPECEVSVFNRWGQLIFFSKGYEQPWDGTYHQELVQSGVYTYQIKTGNNPLATTYRGHLIVVR
ncbi:hypothetical protein GCM10028805_23910 [Spirosoma harenae]